MGEVEDLQYMSLWNGYKIPSVALGTFFGPPPDPQTPNGDQVKSIIWSAIDAGYRHIDTAWAYGTERAVGEAVKEKIQEGVITREEMFITTKLSPAHHDPAVVKDTLRASLKELGMEYVDMYLLHCPVPCKQLGASERFKWDGLKTLDHDQDLLTTWKALEECVKARLARSIGICNFSLKQVCNIVDHAEIQPAVNQVENHPYMAQKALVDGCRARNVRVQASTPLGVGHPCWAEKHSSPLEDPVVKEIASQHGRTPAQVVLRYQLQRGLPLAVKSANNGRIKENIQVFDFQLTKDDMASLAQLNKNFRLGLFDWWKGHKDYPFADE